MWNSKRLLLFSIEKNLVCKFYFHTHLWGASKFSYINTSSTLTLQIICIKVNVDKALKSLLFRGTRKTSNSQPWFTSECAAAIATASLIKGCCSSTLAAFRAAHNNCKIFRKMKA